MRVRAGVGWPEGFVGSSSRCARSRTAPAASATRAAPVVIEDLPNDPSWRARPLREQGVVSSATVLVGTPRAPAGLLGAHSRTKRSFGAQDLDFLTAVAHVLNGALEGLRTEERIRHDALHDALTGPAQPRAAAGAPQRRDRARRRARGAASPCSSSTSTT